MNHHVRMLIGCLVPLLLIFILPLFGVDGGVALFIFIVLMFICHLSMIGDHGHAEKRRSDNDVFNGSRHEHS